MITRIVHLLLCLVVIVGLAFTFRAQLRRGAIRREHDALARQVGLLEVRDRDKFYLTRIDTDSPHHFAWRIYCPEDVNVQSRSSGINGGGTSHTSGIGGERLIRVRFRWEDGGLRVFSKHVSGSSTFGVGNGGFAEFVKAHWDDLEIQVLPIGETREFGTDQIIPVISVAVPESLQSEVRQALGRGYQNEEVRSIFQFRMGTPEAFQAAETGQAM